jgi:Domain of unknown function (DUF309)
VSAARAGVPAMTADEHFRAGVELFNCAAFFEAHEEMEDAMNALEGDAPDFEFYLGCLRAAVANHKLQQGELASAILHLKAALKFLAAYPDRHCGLKLREFRHALSLELARIDGGGADAATLALPRMELTA